MINLGLSTSELRQLMALLVDHHEIQVSVQLLDLSHKYINTLTSRLISGQVDVDASASEATRSCTLELLDPTHSLKLDGRSPEDGSIYYNRMFKIIYSVISPDRSLRFDIPIFCGPLNRVERNGAVLNCTALGKEKLAMAMVWRAQDYSEGAKKTYVIKSILRDLGGEQKIDVPNLDQKMPSKLSMNREKAPWPSAKKLANSMSHILFYNGRGVAFQRPRRRTTVYTFKGRAMLSPVSATFDAEQVINCVEVTGGTPKGAKEKIRYRAEAPRSHSLSPANMGRFNMPRYIPEYIDDSNILDIFAARIRAEDRLANALIEQVEVTFNSLPIPFLEEGDLCRVESEEFTGAFRISKFSIPLTVDGMMSVGYNRRVIPKRKQSRVKGRRWRDRAVLLPRRSN